MKKENNQSVKTTNIIEVSFKLNFADNIMFGGRHYLLWRYCRHHNIDETRIKRILLEMKSEDE